MGEPLLNADGKPPDEKPLVGSFGLSRGSVLNPFDRQTATLCVPSHKPLPGGNTTQQEDLEEEDEEFSPPTLQPVPAYSEPPAAPPHVVPAACVVDLESNTVRLKTDTAAAAAAALHGEDSAAGVQRPGSAEAAGDVHTDRGTPRSAHSSLSGLTPRPGSSDGWKEAAVGAVGNDGGADYDYGGGSGGGGEERSLLDVCTP